MNPIDLISTSPRTFIFQKKSNKTNLGGILTLIYLIFLIILFVLYFFDYSVYEKYEYHDFYKFFENDTQIMTKKKILNIIHLLILVLKYIMNMEIN